MTWVRLDDGFPDHPKVLQAGPLAGWLQVCALAYCNRFLTDGFIPTLAALRLADFTDVAFLADQGFRDAEPIFVIGRLEEVGLWESVEGGYLIHDFEDYQPSREQVLEQRRKTAERVSRFRDRKKQSNAVSNADVTLPPARPVLGSKEPRSVGFAEEVFSYWQQKLDKPRTKLTADRKRKIAARIKEGYTVDDLKRAVDGAVADIVRWPERRHHCGLEVILRGGAQVERFMELASSQNGSIDDENLKRSRDLAARLMREAGSP